MRLHTHTYRVGNLGILIIVACSAIGLVSAGRMRLVTVGYFLLATCFLTHWLVFDVVLVFAAGFVTSANSDGSGLLKRATEGERKCVSATGVPDSGESTTGRFYCSCSRQL